MARARNIKPGFFSNDKLAEIAPIGRLLFAGLWTIADRAGRLEDRPKKIKAEVLPYDSCNVDKLLDELQAGGFILRYSAGGVRYIQILNFEKHQNPHKNEADSTIPAPEQHSTSTVQEPAKDGTTHADSLNLIPDSLKHKSGSGAEPKGRKRPLPAGFGISDRVRAWAESKGFDSLEAHLEHFLGWARARGPTYVDWDQAFMNAIREDWAKLRVGKGNVDMDRLIRELEEEEKQRATH